MNILYFDVAVDMCLMKKQVFAIRFFDWMHKNCNNGCVKPLNTIVFNANEAEKAFRYMTTGKHIGKIVIRIREEESNRGTVQTIISAPELNVVGKNYFNANKVYIITGGLGGTGMELVHWMIYMGARKFLLTSRSGIKTDYQKYVINRLIKFGEKFKYFKVNLKILKYDCLTLESTRNVLSEASKMGQIGGLFHLSFVQNYCLLENFSFDKFCESVDAKHKVFNNFDIETRKLNYNLDYFVVFSSIVCGKGNNGQSNYSFGCSLCERICEQRRKDGLKGLAIQYGAIGDVGVFAEKDQLLTHSTFQKQRINSCFDILDKLLSIDQPIVTSYVRADVKVESGGQKKRLIKELWKSMGIDPNTTPDHLTLGEIGMESMYAVELQQELERQYKLKTSLSHIKSILVKLLKEYEAGYTDNVEKHLTSLKSAREKLYKYKFVIPKESHSPLNSVRTGKPIYFLAPYEITFSAYEEFAAKFERPVIGLNWTKDMNSLETLSDITKHYENLLTKLQPNGKYDIIGYLEGAIVISKLLRKGLINKAVIIDYFNDKIIKEDVFSDDFVEEFFSIFLSSAEIPETYISMIFREVRADPDLDSKLKRITSEMKEFAGRKLIATDLEEIFKIALKRARILFEYRLQKRTMFSNKLKEVIGKKWAKKTGKLSIIKPFNFDIVDDRDRQFNDARDLYLLPDENESKKILTIEGIHSQNPFIFTVDSIGNRILNEFE